MTLSGEMAAAAILLALAFGVGAGMVLARSRRPRMPPGLRSVLPTSDVTTRDNPPTGRPPRRRPGPAPAISEHDLASGARLTMLAVLAERLPDGWSALVLSPPAQPTRMTWHVHLNPRIGLDLADGRTVPATSPTPTHRWTVGDARGVAIGEGDTDPAPTDRTHAVRIDGPYLAVSVTLGEGPPELIAAVPAAGGPGSELRAPLTESRPSRSALRHAVDLAVASRAAGTAPTLSYSVTSWRAHERLWLDVPR